MKSGCTTSKYLLNDVSNNLLEAGIEANSEDYAKIMNTAGQKYVDPLFNFVGELQCPGCGLLTG